MQCIVNGTDAPAVRLTVACELRCDNGTEDPVYCFPPLFVFFLFLFLVFFLREGGRGKCFTWPFFWSNGKGHLVNHDVLTIYWSFFSVINLQSRKTFME